MIGRSIGRPEGVSIPSFWLSVIIPVLNEASCLARCLQPLVSYPGIHVVVVDGGSQDESLSVAASHGVEIVALPRPQRARQLNAGALRAKAEVLLFCHADTMLTHSALAALEARMGEPDWLWGAFYKKYDPDNFVLNTYAWFLNHIHLMRWHRAVGSNAMFMRRCVFERLGGFPDMNFLEDVVMNDRLRSDDSRPCVITQPVVVSSRRYMERGVLRHILTNAYIWLRLKGVLHRPDKIPGLRRWYGNDRADNPTASSVVDVD